MDLLLDGFWAGQLFDAIVSIETIEHFSQVDIQRYLFSMKRNILWQGNIHSHNSILCQVRSIPNNQAASLRIQSY